MAHQFFKRAELVRVFRVGVFAFVADFTRAKETTRLPFLHSYVDW